MTENKDNPPINLELLERQLREALARRPSDSSLDKQSAAHDPLAELSRFSNYEIAARTPQADTLQPTPIVTPPIQSVQNLENQSGRDPYSGFAKFTPSQQSEEPSKPAASTSLRANIPLFQSIAVNYGGFQNSALVQPASDFSHEKSNVHSEHPSDPKSAHMLPTHGDSGAVSALGSPIDQSQNQFYGDITAPAEPVQSASSVQTQPDFPANPYERLEQPAAQIQTQPLNPPQDSIFESRIFSNLRTPVPEPQTISHPEDNTVQRDPMWPPQQEPRAGLSMSEAEAHDDLMHLAHKDNKSQSGGKGAYILLGLLAILGAGFGFAAYLRNEGAVIPTGPAPLISADKAPVKVAPVDQGGTSTNQQAAAIYQPGKMDDPKEAKIVNNEEKPVDVNTVPRPPGAPLLGEPKKIRTVTIRPDGSIVEEIATNAGGAAPNIAATPRPGATVSSNSVPTATAVLPGSNQPSSPVASVTAPQAAPPPAASGPVVRILPPERPQAIASAPVIPTPSPPAAEKTAASLNEKIEAGSGDYGVQFGAPASENEARTMIANLKKANPKIFDGLSFVVQKADNNGRTIFRVRVIGLAREGAISLCEQMKSTGTQCFVAKN
jgi:SPOR domain